MAEYPLNFINYVSADNIKLFRTKQWMFYHTYHIFTNNDEDRIVLHTDGSP